jgi:feruloyl esterase
LVFILEAELDPGAATASGNDIPWETTGTRRQTMTGLQTHRPPPFEQGRLRTVALATAVATVLGFTPLLASAGAGPSGCSALSGIQVRNTTITATQYVTAAGGNYCEVSATVAPQHDMRVRLPDDWKRRYVQLGGGGFDGFVPDLSNGFGTVGKDPVEHGFVVAASNGGHRGAVFPGASFAADRGLTLSYSVAKIYDTDLVANVLMEAYYGEQPAYRYFTGCSNGGKNASVAASNYFRHYDGIVGAAGVWGHNDDNVGGADMPGLTAKWIQTVQVGALAPAKGTALYDKVVQACDGLDGVKDGIVANVEACPVQQIARSLRCKGADDGSCLTDEDLAKVASHTSNLILHKRAIGPAWSPLLNLSTMGASAAGLSTGFLQMAFRSATPIDPSTIDLPTQFPDIKTVLDDVYSMTGDLDGIKKYLARDKKLILFHGWEDNTVPSYGSVNFFKALRKSDPHGSRNARLFMAGGVAHCGGGVGADSTDLLYVMTQWVERNAEPGSPANPALAWRRGAASADISGAQFSRPLCPYPQFPFYRGGNPTQASSYRCEGRDEDD